MDYQETLAYLYGLERFGMVFGLENISRLLQALGDPHRGLKVIHVGGTNGKGSVSAMMASVLEEEGYRVGVYTSPHLVSFTERIQINKAEISWQEVVRLTEFLRRRVKEERIPERFTFFDFTTALAIYYFSLQEMDLAILEVGLGGRLDSTNIVRPLIAVITNVDREHVQILGDNIEDIAREKAGIVKKGVPLISGATQREVTGILEQECERKKAPLGLANRDFFGEKVGPQTLDFRGRRWRWERVQLSLAGSYQIDNATVALATLEALEEIGYEISARSVYDGLAHIRWPGRLELVAKSPQILLDGAHNPAAARALREAVQNEFHYGRLSMILGIMEDKDISGIISELAPLANLLVASRPRNSRAVSPDRLAEISHGFCNDIVLIEDVGAAVEHLRQVAQEDELILVTGSLYTVGEARDYLLSKG